MSILWKEKCFLDQLDFSIEKSISNISFFFFFKFLVMYYSTLCSSNTGIVYLSMLHSTFATRGMYIFKFLDHTPFCCLNLGSLRTRPWRRDLNERSWVGKYKGHGKGMVISWRESDVDGDTVNKSYPSPWLKGTLHCYICTGWPRLPHW